MFIREIKKRFRKNGVDYEYIQHRLVESIRTEHGPRQQTLLNLGTLTIPAEQHKTLANLIEQLLLNCSQTSCLSDAPEELQALARHFADVIIQKRLRTPSSPSAETVEPAADTPEPVYETIDANSVITSDSRTIGAEHIALTQLRELGFFAILDECGFTEREQHNAAAQICSRMVHPASERETARFLRRSSALPELLDADFSHISDQTLHRIADKLFEHKDTIERKLSKNTDDLFSLDNKLVLYDLTNTYFESPKRNSGIAKYGRSKEKRTDCPLLTLALVVDGKGFPKRSRILEGNVSEPQTLWDTLEQLEMADAGDNHPRTVVIDAGIATEENLERLRADKRFEYVAISRQKRYDGDIFADASAQDVPISNEQILSIKTARHGEETLLLCKSPDRQLKEAAIHELRRKRFEKGISELNEGLKKPHATKNLLSIHERIGRLKERYKVGHCYTIDVKGEGDRAREIAWSYCDVDKEKEFGEYMIRTSRNDLVATDISLVHRTLTMIESAFAWLKSDLGLRPNFHQKDDRMSTHAIISVLAYFVLAPILSKLEWGGKFISSCGKTDDHAPWEIPFGWKGLVRTMSSQTRVTTSFNCKDGSRMDVRTTVEPTTEQSEIYKRLQVNPRPLKRIIRKQ
jgi:transposase